MGLLSIKNITLFTFIFDAYREQNIIFISPKYLSRDQMDLRFLHIFTYEKLWLKYHYIKINIKIKQAEGFAVCHDKSKRYNYTLNNNIHVCLTGIIISSMSVCDGYSDCADSFENLYSTDEQNCNCSFLDKNCRDICQHSDCRCTNVKCFRFDMND